jgi:hypothetical protein
MNKASWIGRENEKKDRVRRDLHEEKFRPERRETRTGDTGGKAMSAIRHLAVTEDLSYRLNDLLFRRAVLMNMAPVCSAATEFGRVDVGELTRVATAKSRVGFSVQP